VAEAAVSPLASTARAYLNRGWVVLPIAAGGKRPLIQWHVLQGRHPSDTEVQLWCRRWPDANIGLVTGAVSGLVVLDVDPTHGGEASLRELESAHGPLPPTPEVLTGGGGRHLYFAHPGALVRNAVGLLPGLDIRGDGGYVVAPPSRHASGRPYRWAPGRTPADCPLAPFPHWLSQRARQAGHPLAYWRRLVREGVAEGQRNSTIASLSGHLLWHGVDPEVVLELMLSWNRLRCRPPLPDAEVARTVESISRLHGRAPW
jgi:hypothetical protein